MKQINKLTTKNIRAKCTHLSQSRSLPRAHCSLILTLAALTIENVQKRKNDFKQLKIIKIITYAVFAAAIIIFVGGVFYSME